MLCRFHIQSENAYPAFCIQTIYQVHVSLFTWFELFYGLFSPLKNYPNFVLTIKTKKISIASLSFYLKHITSFSPNAHSLPTHTYSFFTKPSLINSAVYFWHVMYIKYICRLNYPLHIFNHIKNILPNLS